MWQIPISRLINAIIDNLTRPSGPRTTYGPQVDAWGAYIPMRGNLERNLQDRVVIKMRAKGLNGLSVTRQNLRFHDSMFTGGGGEAREHGVFTQNLGNGGRATVAVRIARRGVEDLEISWRLFERNVQTEQNRTVIPFVGAFIILTVMVLIVSRSRSNLFDGTILYSLFVMIVCLSITLILLVTSLFGAINVFKGVPTVSTHQHLDTLVLGETIQHVLLLALDELGVQPHELRVVRQAQIVGK